MGNSLTPALQGLQIPENIILDALGAVETSRVAIALRIIRLIKWSCGLKFSVWKPWMSQLQLEYLSSGKPSQEMAH